MDAKERVPLDFSLGGPICDICDQPLCLYCGFCRVAHRAKDGVGVSQATGEVFCESYVPARLSQLGGEVHCEHDALPAKCSVCLHAEAAPATSKGDGGMKCDICDGVGSVDSGGFTPWGEGIEVKCGRCDGTGEVESVWPIESPQVDPCPFCGQDAEETHANDLSYYYVGCANQDCWVQPETGRFTSEKLAREAWNWKSVRGGK